MKKKATKERAPKLDKTEREVLHSIYLGANSQNAIADSANMSSTETKSALENLEGMGLVERKLLGLCKLTEIGLGQIELGKVDLDVKLMDQNVRHGEETDLWVFAKNSGNTPLGNIWLRITAPRFIEIHRHNANRAEEGEKSVIEFPLAQMHPGEAQHVNFKVKGFLTSGAMASKYKIDVQALVDERETDKKELNIAVTH